MSKGGRGLGPNYARALPEIGAVAMAVQGRWVLVDAEDYPRVRPHRWYWVRNKVAARVKSETLYLTKLILDTPQHIRILRISEDVGDYRKANLRMIEIF